MYDLKIDPKLHYHYFISVGVRSMHSSTPGRMFLKHGPLKFTNDDVKKMQDVSLMANDKLFPTSNKEALSMYDMTDFSQAVWSMSMAAAANQCTVHHFSSDGPIPDDYWEGFVDRANENEFERRKLFGAKLRPSGFV